MQHHLSGLVSKPFDDHFVIFRRSRFAFQTTFIVAHFKGLPQIGSNKAKKTQSLVLFNML